MPVSSKSLHQGPSDSLATSVAADWAALTELLGTAIALSRNKTIRDLALVRSGFDADTSFAAALGAAHGWMEFMRGLEPKAARMCPEHLPVIDIAALSIRDDQFRTSLRAAAAPATITALRMLAILFRSSPGTTRLEAAKLDPWIPLLEKPAYRLCAKLSDILDRTRRIIVGNLEAGKKPRDELLFYWAILQTSARLTLLASEPAAACWLADLATSFKWQRWTPSMALLRERTSWLAACAARSAIAFGTTIIPNYLAALGRSNHAMVTFDALYGLSAIGLSAPDERKPIVKEIASLRDTVIGNDTGTQKLTNYLFENSLAILRTARQPAEDAASLCRLLGWRRGGSEGFASGPAMRIDPTESLSAERIIAFAMLPIVVSAPKENFYAERFEHARAERFGVSEIEKLFRRAWIDTEVPEIIYH
jgi:hypothetical protein